MRICDVGAIPCNVDISSVRNARLSYLSQQWLCGWLWFGSVTELLFKNDLYRKLHSLPSKVKVQSSLHSLSGFA